MQSSDPSDWVGRLFSWVIFGAVILLPIARSVIESLGLGKKKESIDEQPRQRPAEPLDSTGQPSESAPTALDIFRAAREHLAGEGSLVSAEPAPRQAKLQAPTVQPPPVLRQPLQPASNTLGAGALSGTAVSTFGTEEERDLAWPTLVPSTLGAAQNPSENALEARGREVSRRVDLTPTEVPVVVKRSSRWSGQDWRRAIVAREVLGPPRALDELESF